MTRNDGFAAWLAAGEVLETAETAAALSPALGHLPCDPRPSPAGTRSRLVLRWVHLLGGCPHGPGGDCVTRWRGGCSFTAASLARPGAKPSTYVSTRASAPPPPYLFLFFILKVLLSGAGVSLLHVELKELDLGDQVSAEGLGPSALERAGRLPGSLPLRQRPYPSERFQSSSRSGRC